MKLKNLLPLMLMLVASVLPVRAQQAAAQQGQPLYPVNAKYVQGVGPGYWPTAGTALELNVAAGTCNLYNTVYTYAGGTLTMAASTTNYVYLDTENSCTPSSNTTGFCQRPAHNKIRLSGHT